MTIALNILELVWEDFKKTNLNPEVTPEEVETVRHIFWGGMYGLFYVLYRDDIRLNKVKKIMEEEAEKPNSSIPKDVWKSNIITV